jgi:membrane associated rhomboid family serine protease
VLEPAIGRLNFAAIYFASLLAGSFGALLFQPLALTVGASGAIFGIFGALIVVARARGIPIWQSGLGPVLLINLLFSVSFSGISIGGHLGGLVAGLISGWLVVEFSERRRMPWVAPAACLVIAVLSVVGAIAVAGSHGLAPHGIGFTG